MRFCENGPNIPDELLDSRDKGDVVFLCGAGVSAPAGMPDFLKLTKKVFDDLYVAPDSQLRSLLRFAEDDCFPEEARPSFDLIFNLLQQTYQPIDIDRCVARHLEIKGNPCVSTHKTVLRLSKGSDGSPQIVTTNFDLLFQYADDQIECFTPPALPDLSGGLPLRGLVHLHGRINSEAVSIESRQEFVLSSSDFGRAYLAQGWATRFMLELLDRYTVVLLGYSANDPPVKYLLQGLQSSGQQRGDSIYAFVGESTSFDQSIWDSRGVTALTYPLPNGRHDALWNTLEAWADRADDLLIWQQNVAKLAQSGPRNLEKYQRGQVVSLVKTPEGAQVFADTEPPPPAEWLCVFDSEIRTKEPSRATYGNPPDFNFQEVYGLDDDSHYPKTHENNRMPQPINTLAIIPQDSRSDSLLRIAGMPPPELFPVPERLRLIAVWIAKVSHEPMTLWWAAKRQSLHPFLIGRIRHQLRQNDHAFPVPARKIWNMLLDTFQSPPKEHDFSLLEISERANIEGWTPSVLREFEKCTMPRFEIKPHEGRKSSHPPSQEWTDIHPSDIATFDIVFPRTTSFNAHISTTALPTAYRTLRRQLECALSLLADLDQNAQEEMKLYLQYDSESMLGEDPNLFVQWFCDLLDQMAESHPKLLRADVELWPENEAFFFDRLRLRAWSAKSAFSGREVVENLLSLPDNLFWSFSHRSILLHLMRDRWNDFPLENRTELEQRIVKGPPTP